MYKPFNRAVPPAKPNAWENAVYLYATAPLTDAVVEPTTRIEQLAKAFVFSEKASNISCLKEINRCIAVCEAYATYQEDPDGFGNNLQPPQIIVRFGKEDPAPAEAQSSVQENETDVIKDASAGLAVRNEPAPQLPAEPSGDANLTPEQADFMAQVEQLHKLEFSSAQEARQAHQEMNRLANSPVYRTLSPSKRGDVKFALTQAKDKKERLEEKEAQQQTKVVLDDISSCR